MTITDDYQPMLTALNVRSVKEWLARYNRMTMKEKDDLLKTYGLSPDQYKLRHVQDALEQKAEKQAPEQGRGKGVRTGTVPDNVCGVPFTAETVERLPELFRGTKALIESTSSTPWWKALYEKRLRALEYIEAHKDSIPSPVTYTTTISDGS